MMFGRPRGNIKCQLWPGSRWGTLLACATCLWFSVCADWAPAAGLPIFGPAHPVTGVNTDWADSVGDISPDGMTLYFQSTRNGEFDLFSARRASPGGAFGAATEFPFQNVNASSDFNMGNPTLSDDGLELFYHVHAAGGEMIHRATRTSTSSPFVAPSLVPEVNIPGALWTRPDWLSSDGLRLYYSAFDGGNSSFGYVATRPTRNSPFGEPSTTTFETLNRIGTGIAELFLTDDELTVLFNADHPGGMGGLDIWQATRDDVESPFGEPLNLRSVNTNRVDRKATLFGDELFFTSTRGHANDRFKDFDIYRAVRIGTEPSSASDLTRNGFVDFEDLTILLAAWNQHVPPEEGNLVDPFRTPVNFDDLTVLLADWTGPGPAGSPEAAMGDTAVPEPSSLLLTLLAALGLSFYRRRRRRN